MTITPLGIPAVWAAVMDAADHRCQCSGACGSKHSRSAMRCDRATGHDRLLAAPADLLLTPAAAAAVPVAQLLAWCAPCHHGATGRQRAAERERRRQEQPEPASLF